MPEWSERMASWMSVFETQNVGIKFDGTLDLGHFQMHMTDAHPRINWLMIHLGPYVFFQFSV